LSCLGRFPAIVSTDRCCIRWRHRLHIIFVIGTLVFNKEASVYVRCVRCVRCVVCAVRTVRWNQGGA
jgi:hypothetical protein